MMWSGTNTTIPSGWSICDGTTVSTSQGLITKPNLRGSFVLCASSSYAVNTTAGSTSISLQSTHIPAHTHVTDTTSITPDHTHIVYTRDGSGDDLVWRGRQITNASTSTSTAYENHVHTYTTPAGGGVSTAVTPISLLPRCYALVYIIKIPV
jgi:microcystin-dependent protein